MTYEELLILADSENLIVKEKDIPGYGGRIYKNRIAINRTLPTQTEKSCVLAEEIGHHCTTAGDILDQTDVMNQKQEYRARLYVDGSDFASFQILTPLSTPLIHLTNSVAPSILSVAEEAANAQDPVGVYLSPSQSSPTTYGATPRFISG